MYYAMSAESAPHTGDIPGSPFGINVIANGASEEREAGGENKTVSDRSTAGGSLAEAVERAVVGLGIALPAERPSGDVSKLHLSADKVKTEMPFADLCRRVDQQN
jgi:hypothetical protein